MAAYHISPTTGNPNLCKAQEGNCPFGADEPHFDSKDEARSHYEKHAETYVLRARERELIAERLAFDAATSEAWVKAPTKFGRIWTTKTELGIPREEYDALVAGIRASDDELTAIRRKLEPVPPYVHLDETGLVGLDDARMEVFGRANRSPYFTDPEDEFYFDKNPKAIVEETLARYRAGHTVPEDNGYLVLPKDRLLNVLTKDNNGLMSSSQMNLLLTFPEEYVGPTLEKLGVENVSVAPFYNTREWGLAYTVLDPEGNTRTFSVYENRNTDSIIINGLTNWDPVNDLPYAADSGHKFFAEFAPTDRRQAADALGFFLKEAKNGELPSDKTLVEQAEHLDWNAILSEQIPGFGDWAQKNGHQPKKRWFED